MSEIIEATPRAELCIRWDEALEEHGPDVIPLSVADMDLAAPPAVIAAVAARAQQGAYGYTYVPDSYYLCVQDWMRTRFNWDVAISSITYVPRVIQAVSVAIDELTAPDAGVLVHSPSYGPLTNLIEPLGRRLVTSELRLSNGRYEIDFEETDRLLATEARVLLLCSPHNPTGRVWTREELTRLAEIAERHDALIISDEVHADLVRTGHQHVPIASLDPGTAQRTVTMTSPAKPFNLAGLEVANMIVENDNLQRPVQAGLDRRGFHNPSYFAVPALEAAYGNSSEWLAALLDHVEGNLRILREFTSLLPGIDLVEPEGTYLAWLDCRAWTPDEKILKDWMRNARVALSLGSSFGPGNNGFVRLNLAVTPNTLRTALDRLGNEYTNSSKENTP